MCRDVWQHSIAAGAHAYLLAFWGWLAGTGKPLDTQQPADSKQPLPAAPRPIIGKSLASRKQHVPDGIPSESTDGWCVLHADHGARCPESPGCDRI